MENGSQWHTILGEPEKWRVITPRRTWKPYQEWRQFNISHTTCMGGPYGPQSLRSLTTSSSRLKRLAIKLQPWMVTIQDTPGKDNLMADALSRQE